MAEDFQDEFVRAIHIPHATDLYPHLEGILPVAVGAGGEEPMRARRRTRTLEIGKKRSQEGAKARREKEAFVLLRVFL